MAGRASKKGLGLLGFRCEDGQAFALELISQQKCIGDIGLSGGGWKVDRLRDAAVARALKAACMRTCCLGATS